MSSKNNGRRDPAYIREQGNRGKVEEKKRFIMFSLSKHIQGEGQTIEEWDDLGLLKALNLRMKYIGQHTVHDVKQKKYIKEYHKVAFPDHSKFTHPKHIANVTWAVMHLTDKSKEVVAGYIENDVFYIVFLDMNHDFWPTALKNT